MSTHQDTGPASTHVPFGQGYACPSCGTWVQPGLIHSCKTWPSTPLAPASWPWQSLPVMCGWEPPGYYCGRKATVREVYQTKDGSWCERFWCDQHAPEKAEVRQPTQEDQDAR